MKRYRQLLVFLRPFWAPLLAALGFTGTLTLIGMAPPLIMRRLLNDVARQGNWGLFPLAIGLLVAVPVLRAVVNIGNAIALNRVNQGIVARTRKRLFRHLMRLSMKYYNDTPVGNINQRLMGDVGTVSQVVTGGLVGLVADVVSVGFAVVIMWQLSGPMSALTFGLLPFYFLNYKFFAKRIQQNTALLRNRMDHISSMLQERLSAHELIQSYGQDRAENMHFASQAKQIMDAAIHGASYSISFNHLSAFINKIGNTSIYCLGCYLFIKEHMGYGDVVAFCAYATQLLGPVVRFSSFANQAVQAGVSVDRINEIMSHEPAIREAADPVEVGKLRGHVQLDGVTFHYGDEPALRGVQLDIEPGAHVAIVGPPGSGRTTLAMLLRRFFEPSDGCVRLDDRDIREYRLRDYRGSLALVLPESTVFTGTIRDNLCYGNRDATEERMIEVAKAVGIHDLVEDLAEDYDARLGAGGVTLSAGDRQRIGIARALLSDPLVLIADEATAVLDPESAEEANRAIRQLMAGRTCLFIVNRVLMAKDTDEVVVMNEGTVVERGTHEDLLSTEGTLYRELFGRQYGEDRLPAVS